MRSKLCKIKGDLFFSRSNPSPHGQGGSPSRADLEAYSRIILRGLGLPLTRYRSQES